MPPIGSDSHGDGDTIPEYLKEDYFPPDFKEYMLMEQLNWSRHKNENDFWGSGWVFWSQQDHEIEPPHSLDNCADFNRNVCPIPKVRDNIRLALQKLIPSKRFYHSLVQFWAATTTLEGRTKLTTQYQPFALGGTLSNFERQQLCEYRMKMCRDYNFFYADAESGEEQQLGLPGRVFLHKSPEYSPNHVEYYSEKEYPQRDLALHCKIRGSWAVPVCEHSSQTCVGVLEMVSLYNMSSDWRSKSFLRDIRDSFQEFDLIYLDGCCEMQCRDDNIIARTIAFQELNMVLRSVCKIHELPLAMTWVPLSASDDLLRGQLMSKVLDYVKEEDSDEEDSDEEGFIDQFLEVSKFTHLKKGGISERVLSSPYMLYCSDITQLSIAECPLVLHARICNFNGWFTICLQSSLTEKEICVVDFFLPKSSKDDENILTMLSSILETMGEKFKTFKLASGKQLGEILLVEVMDFRSGKKLPFVRSGMNVVSEEQNYILPSLEALQNREVMMQLDSPRQLPLDPSNNGHNVVITEENIIVVAGLEEGKRKRQREHKGTGVRIEVSLDDILKCAKMKMKRKEAAEHLKVSESTFKRALREYSIDRWPPRNIENVSQFWRPSPVENHGQTPQLNSDLPSNQAIAGVAHINPGFQDANTVTIRGKYKNKTIKFHLSMSSRLVEFQQEVAKRLHLEAGTYYAEYKDEEGELIFIACDDDLQACLHTSRSLGNSTIEVLLQLEEPLINLNPAN